MSTESKGVAMTWLLPSLSLTEPGGTTKHEADFAWGFDRDGAKGQDGAAAMYDHDQACGNAID